MAITPVSGQLGTGANAGGNTVTVTIPSGITQGNLVIIQLGWNTTTGTVSGPSGWSAATAPVVSAGGAYQAQTWYLVTDAGTAGQASFGFSWTASAASCGYAIREWNSDSGWLASPLDQVSTGNASGTTVSTGTTPATASPAELWLALLGWGNSGDTESGLTAGFTPGQHATTTGVSVREAYQVVSATGTAACSETLSAFEQTAACMATFAAAPVIVPPPFIPSLARAPAVIVSNSGWRNAGHSC